MKMRSVLFALSLPALAATPAVAAMPVPVSATMAAPTGNDVLAELDRRAKVFGDQQYTAQMAIYKGGDLKKTLEFNMVMKGLTKQFIIFTAPGDAAGMKVLMQDKDTLYVYMPEFKKVRRVAAHVQNQGFMGGHFTYEDQVHVGLSLFYDAEIKGTNGSETTLTLKPKEGVQTTYGRIDIVIDSTKGGVTKLHYYDGSGNHKRTQTRDNWIKIDGGLMPTKITMTEIETGDYTVISLDDILVNQGVSDDQFSRRMLLRG